MDSRNKKRLTAGLGITAAAAAALALTADTLALFNDDESTSGSISAGTLDLVAGGDAVSSPINITGIKPGDAAVKQLDLENIGSLPGTLTLNVAKISDMDVSCNEAEDADGAVPDGRLPLPGLSKMASFAASTMFASVSSAGDHRRAAWQV